MKRPLVYKRDGNWWVAWKRAPNVWWTNTCFDTAYNEAQWFANSVSIDPTRNPYEPRD